MIVGVGSVAVICLCKIVDFCIKAFEGCKWLILKSIIAVVFSMPRALLFVLCCCIVSLLGLLWCFLPILPFLLMRSLPLLLFLLRVMSWLAIPIPDPISRTSILEMNPSRFQPRRPTGVDAIIWWLHRHRGKRRWRRGPNGFCAFLIIIAIIVIVVLVICFLHFAIFINMGSIAR